MELYTVILCVMVALSAVPVAFLVILGLVALEAATNLLVRWLIEGCLVTSWALLSTGRWASGVIGRRMGGQ